MRIILVFLFCFGLLNLQAAETHESGVVLVKVKPEYRSSCTQNGINLETFTTMLADRAIAVTKEFSNARPPLARNKNGYATADLSLIYRVALKPGVQELKVLKQLQSVPELEYATLNYYAELASVPNDPMFTQQYHHTNIGSAAGWTLQTGNGTVRIAILDTGSDLDHPDLAANHYTNPNDPPNGVDDDNNGYTDDTYGWDFIDNDGVPQATVNDHGVHVGGLAAAATNNAIGIAGTGYNCVHVPIRVGEDRAITAGYQGIVYAADQGFDIINCSWGSFNSSPFAQDVITYAAINKGALVVAAAGNSGADRAYYPAAYNYVLAVGALQQDNQRANFSNYGYWVDIMAPGLNILSTLNDGDYGSNSGTSMASPIVAGVAGLVKASYPGLTGLQIAERIKATATDISQVGGNGFYENKIGKGMVNPGGALNGSITHPAVVYENIEFTDGNDEAFSVGDTISIGGVFTNYLNATDSLTATLTANSLSISPINMQAELGELATMSSTMNYNNPFTFQINAFAGVNETVVLELEITDGTYTTKQFTEININVDFLNVLVNNIETTVAGNSSIGYTQRDGSDGLGFRLVGANSQLYESNFMVGFKAGGATGVIDNVRNGQQLDSDFSAKQAIQLGTADDTAFFASGVFSDFRSGGDSVGIDVSYKALAFDDDGHENYVILEYALVNISGQVLDSVYGGLFTDWDVAPYDQNKALYSTENKVVYSQSTNMSSGLFGVSSLLPGEPNVYCFDNVVGGNGGIDLYNSFTTQEKFLALKGGRLDAGTSFANGTDVIQMMSQGPYTLNPGDTAVFAFAILGNLTEEQIISTADSAFSRYNGELITGLENQVLTDETDVLIYPNPVRDHVQIKTSSSTHLVQVFNTSGQMVLERRNETQIDFSGLRGGSYIIRVIGSDFIRQEQLIKQ